MIGTIERRARVLGLGDGAVILSFDDGPVPGGQTLALLDVLERRQVRAAFCLIGARVRGQEEVVQRIASGQHLIVNHGFSHRVPDAMSEAAFFQDLEQFDLAIADALESPGWRSRYFRPPGGRWTGRMRRLLAAGGRQLMPTTFFAWDFVPVPARRWWIGEIMMRSLRRQRGGLFLLHEAIAPLGGERFPVPARRGRDWLVPLVDRWIGRVRAEGYRFVEPDAFVWPSGS